MNGGNVNIVEGNISNANISDILPNQHLTRSNEIIDENGIPSPKINDTVNDSSSMTQHGDQSILNLIARSKKLIINVYGNDIQIKSPFKIGNVFSFCYINNMPLIIIGPQYIFAILALVGINVIFILVIVSTFDKIPVFMRILGLMVYITQITSHLLSIMINPGIPNKNYYITDDVIQVIAQNINQNMDILKKYRKCDICNILVQTKNNVGHCEKCNICVEGQITHSKIIGKCIGKNNTTSFHVYVTSSILLLLYIVFDIVVFAITNSMSQQ